MYRVINIICIITNVVYCGCFNIFNYSLTILLQLYFVGLSINQWTLDCVKNNGLDCLSDCNRSRLKCMINIILIKYLNDKIEGWHQFGKNMIRNYDINEDYNIIRKCNFKHILKDDMYSNINYNYNYVKLQNKYGWYFRKPYNSEYYMFLDTCTANLISNVNNNIHKQLILIFYLFFRFIVFVLVYIGFINL